MQHAWRIKLDVISKLDEATIMPHLSAQRHRNNDINTIQIKIGAADEEPGSIWGTSCPSRSTPQRLPAGRSKTDGRVHSE
eukprot:1412013-Alexandrium_andersonii.AAC.1